MGAKGVRVGVAQWGLWGGKERGGEKASGPAVRVGDMDGRVWETFALGTWVVEDLWKLPRQVGGYGATVSWVDHTSREGIDWKGLDGKVSGHPVVDKRLLVVGVNQLYHAETPLGDAFFFAMFRAGFVKCRTVALAMANFPDRPAFYRCWVGGQGFPDREIFGLVEKKAGTGDGMGHMFGIVAEVRKESAGKVGVRAVVAEAGGEGSEEIKKIGQYFADVVKNHCGGEVEVQHWPGRMMRCGFAGANFLGRWGGGEDVDFGRLGNLRGKYNMAEEGDCWAALVVTLREFLVGETREGPRGGKGDRWDMRRREADLKMLQEVERLEGMGVHLPSPRAEIVNRLAQAIQAKTRANLSSSSSSKSNPPPPSDRQISFLADWDSDKGVAEGFRRFWAGSGGQLGGVGKVADGLKPGETKQVGWLVSWDCQAGVPKKEGEWTRGGGRPKKKEHHMKKRKLA